MMTCLKDKPVGEGDEDDNQSVTNSDEEKEPGFSIVEDPIEIFQLSSSQLR